MRIPFAVSEDSAALQREALEKANAGKVLDLQAHTREIGRAQVVRLVDIRHVTQLAKDLQTQLHVSHLSDHQCFERLERLGWPGQELSQCEHVLRMVDAWDEMVAAVQDRMKAPNCIGGPSLLKQLSEVWTAISKLGGQYVEIQNRARSASGLISAFADRLASDARLETMPGLRRGLASVLGDPAVRKSLEELGAELPPLESSCGSHPAPVVADKHSRLREAGGNYSCQGGFAVCWPTVRITV